MKNGIRKYVHPKLHPVNVTSTECVSGSSAVHTNSCTDGSTVNTSSSCVGGNYATHSVQGLPAVCAGGQIALNENTTNASNVFGCGTGGNAYSVGYPASSCSTGITPSTNPPSPCGTGNGVT